MTTYQQTSNIVYIGGDTPNDGKVLGHDASDLIAFYGGTPLARTSLTTLASSATIATTTASVVEIIAMLRNLGLAG